MHSLISDVRHALRTIRQHPFVTLAAMLSVAICTGPNSALFSVVSSVLLRPWPVEKPNELVYVYIVQHHKGGMSYPDYEDLAQRSRSFAGAIAWERGSALVRIHGQAELHTVDDVSRNYFSVLGVRPWAGGFFAPATRGNPTGEPEVVLSHRLWTRRFGSASDVVGSTIYLNGQAYAVVGIAPPAFRGLEFQAPVDLWITIDSLPALLKAKYMRRDERFLYGLGRLRQGITLEQARAEVNLIAQQLGQEYPATNKDCEAELVEAAQENSRVGFFFSGIVMCPVNLVLFIACANIANLMLARAARQRRQTAIRAALGAGRLRIFRQFLTESVLLSIGGTAMGLLLAAGLVYGINRVTPSILPIDYDLHMDHRVLLYSILLAFAMGAAFGAWPAIQASRRNALADLNPTSGAFAGSRGRMPILKGLLIVQIAAAQFLAAGAFAFLSSYSRALKMNPGLDVDRKLLLISTVSFDLSKRMDWGGIADELGALPGVRRATYAGPVPLGDTGMDSVKIAVPGANAPDAMRSVGRIYVGPGYFGVLGTRVLAGRDFVRQDLPASKSAWRVVALNETAARRLWPNTPPNQVVGRWIQAEGNDLQVVAVVEDGKYASFYEQPRECLFEPLGQAIGDMTLVVETAGEPSALVGLVRRELHEAHPNLEFVTASTMKQHLWRARRLEFAGSVLLGILGALAVALACVGLYGSASYTASSRSQELGIRIALGAQRGDVLWLCLRQGAVIALAGLAVGLSAAYALTQMVSRALAGAGGGSLLSFLASVLLIGSIAMLAIFVPAHRATRVDPVVALRAE